MDSNNHGYPFDGSDRPTRQQVLNAQMAQQALEMEEALYLQRHQELDRDNYVHRFLLQGQLQQEALSNAAASLHASRLYFGGSLGGGGLAAQLQEHEYLLQRHEQVRRANQFQQQILAQTQQNERNSEKRAADALAEAALRRLPTSNASVRKRSVDLSEADAVPSNKRAARQGDSASDKTSSKNSSTGTKVKNPRKKQSVAGTGASVKKQTDSSSAKTEPQNQLDENAAVEALAAFGNGESPQESPFIPSEKGTVTSLLTAAEAEEKMDSAAEVMARFKATVNSDDLRDNIIYDSDEVIDLPSFRSVLPRLPTEPDYLQCVDPIPSVTQTNEPSIESTSQGQAFAASKTSSETKARTLSMTIEYPYPVDTWWPSVTSIRRELRSKGEKSDEEDFAEESIQPKESMIHLRVDLPTIRARLATECEPGVLEKFPHCRIHRMAMKTQKVANAPDHAFCWQVTENYCNDTMVCCSICSTWRHAGCGGHFKPMTIRETIDTPFVPICDRCHAESEILADFPKARSRLERQRVEQLRRALATTHVIRQASFAKHGGTYKWPLGSVSTTHISGHTRSVHSRHDKAEKQWSEMVTRLSRVSGFRPKERVKVRTRELERLLVSIEDSEGVLDRHNMMLFLQRDTDKEKPVGYELQLVNVFDPEDDLAPFNESDEPYCANEIVTASDKADIESEDELGVGAGSRNAIRKNAGVQHEANVSRCAAPRCFSRPRFDSIFCSDACGVTALELDLLHAFQYANDIHPSFLRS